MLTTYLLGTNSHDGETCRQLRLRCEILMIQILFFQRNLINTLLKYVQKKTETQIRSIAKREEEHKASQDVKTSSFWQGDSA